MSPIRPIVSRLGCGLLLALAPACGGNGDNGPWMFPVPSLILECAAGSAPAPDQIGFECPASSQGVLPVQVVIGGPTTSADIYGVKFDLVFDSTKLHYEGDSLTGSFLTKEGGTVSGLASVADADPDRLVVAVSLQGSASGVQVTGVLETVAAFHFRGTKAGPSIVRFENGEVVDSTLNPIASLSFSGQIQVEVR